MTDYPGEQFPPAVDPDVEPGHAPEPDESSEPDYDAEPGPESAYDADRPSAWVNPTLQGRPHTDPLLAGFTVYGDPTPEPEPEEDTEQAFEASLEEPVRHSFVDDGPEEYDEPAAREESPEPAFEPEVEVEPAAAPVPAPQSYGRPDAESFQRAAAPTPAAPVAAPVPAAPRPPVPSPGQTFPRPAAPAAARPAPSTPAPMAPRPAPAPAAVVPAGEGEREDGVHPLVEETMARLDELRERPIGEHAEVYADLHERLQTALVEADADHGDRG
ncbi:hypothetical protein AB0P21_34390 [Kribbella sp. NPDC056861]|uniref:hypothetical protein n=1 Tax=Kribbella sp. NPDC056861 TaxID=3154857 RepID=UPI00341343E0